MRRLWRNLKHQFTMLVNTTSIFRCKNNPVLNREYNVETPPNCVGFSDSIYLTNVNA